jgi:N utilization substance protein A
MFDIKALNKAIEQLASEKDLEVSQVLEAVEAALASAYKKEYEKKGEVVRCHLDSKKGELKFYQVKTVVDETTARFEEPEEGGEEKPKNKGAKSEPVKAEIVEGETLLPLYNSERHLLIEDAKKIKSDAVVGDEIFFDLESPSSDFGRIAAQTAKQVVLQKLREIEKLAVKSEFENKTGSLVTGTVQRIERGNVFVDLGKASGVMFFSESIPGEHYRIGERLKFYLLSVQEGGRGPQLMLSRSHPKFVSKLFELEVPEIADGIVQVKGIVREPGSRTKIAVASTAEGVDPVGACVGQRGARVMAVNNEIGNEKIDIIDWSDDPARFVSNSLSPATVTSTEIKDRHEALVLVPEDQLSLAIGKGGQNVRLAAKLAGYKIDVRSQSNPNAAPEGGMAAAEKSEEE